MKARYDCKYEHITFDFYYWLVTAALRGATEIVFDTRELAPELRHRFDSIIAPGPALLGLPCREGTDGDRLPTHPGSRFKLWHFVDVANAGPLPRLRSVLPAGSARYTVTMRNQTRQP